MDNEYKVGALGDLIASNKTKKNKKTSEKNEKKNIESQPESKVNADNLCENEISKKSSKRKSKKNSSEVSAKKIKKDNNKALGTPLIEVKTIDTKSPTDDGNNPDSLESLNVPKKIKKKKIKNKDSNSNIENESKPFEKVVKKKKNKKTKDELTKTSEKSNHTTKANEQKSSMSKSTDIKSSADYIEKESRTVFVGNIPVSVKMSAIKNLFKKFGEIETTRLRSVAVKNLDVPKRVSIMKGDFHPQRDTANVYVRFKTVEEAQNALVLNASQFEGHTIRVDMALNTGHKQNKKKGVFIGNLPYNIQEDEIWDFFKDCGTISAVRIVRDNATGVSKGFGYVDFETKESVELAMQLQGKRVQNRELRIKRIETKSNTNNMFGKRPMPFKNTKPTPYKKTKPLNKGSQSFQGETMKPKLNKKKQKLTKTELMRKKIAKKLNA